ncbi:hypothetical protein GIB67_042993 [Kingdonia uniflora]|uniref:LMBR1-like membrane protein n=1 Tax=Kingdonia uniflora TaxID=39325 RepID=A0A7J7NT79_9MAGN|nr:hypothetical protein GIB67_042993 [Kingdonia uniflora]
MWVFYLISLPLTMGMVLFTLKYFTGPDVPRYVLFTVGYAWFCSLSIIILVPADIWTTIIGHQSGGIAFFWSWSYWSTFLLTWAVVPTIQGYEDAGDFTVPERLKTSLRENLVFYLCVGSIGLLGLVLLIIMRRRSGGVVGLAMACSNTFGLVTGAFLLGFGLSEIPRSIWRNADWNTRQKVLSHKVAKMAVKLDDAHQEFSNAIVIPAFSLGRRLLLQFCGLGGHFGVGNTLNGIYPTTFLDFSTYLPMVSVSDDVDSFVEHIKVIHDAVQNKLEVAQATSNQMSKRDPLRPYMDIIDNMLRQMLMEDPSFKPQGGRLGENDMDYDTDEKSMATLRRQLRRAREEYYRYKSEYMTYVVEALEVEDTIRNYERRNTTGWKYVSSFRPGRTGKTGSILDTIELVWRCILRKQLEKSLAIIFWCMTAAILLAEATILPSGVDLSLFSILINAVGKYEVLVQAASFVPLMYMCICTYYSLFKVGMLMFYSLTPRQTSSVSLLMICSMVARYASPISYNFLNLICLSGDAKTIFEKRMGNIDDAVPFFGRGFNKIYPLIMVIYTLLVASNFFDRIIDFFGSWKRFRLQNEADDMDGFDPSGIIIIQKERSWMEQGSNIGEHVIPLARNFNNMSNDLESDINKIDKGVIEMKAATSIVREEGKGIQSKALKEESRVYATRSENIGSKYTILREQQIKQASNPISTEKNITSSSVSLINEGNSNTTGLTSTWISMKTNFQNFKANIGAKKFLPLRQVQETNLVTRVSSSESLDEIFQRLKKSPIAEDHGVYSDDDDDNMEVTTSRTTR